MWLLSPFWPSSKCHRWRHMIVARPTRPFGVVQNPHALARSSRWNNVQDLPYYFERASKGMVQQTYPKLYLHLQGVEWTLCHALHQGTKIQKILSGHTKYYVVGRWKPNVIRNLFQQKGPPNWQSQRQSPCHCLHLWVMTRGVSLLPPQNDPKTMAETLYKATKYINAEDAMIA